MIQALQSLMKGIRDDFRVVLGVFAVPSPQGFVRAPKVRKRGQRGALGCGSLLVMLVCIFLFGAIGGGLFGPWGLVLGVVAAIGLGIVIANQDEEREREERKQEKEEKKREEEQRRQAEAQKVARGTLIPCRGCDRNISPLAEACPNCGRPQDPAVIAEARDMEAKRIADEKERGAKQVAEVERQKREREAAAKAQKEFEDANPHLFCPACGMQLAPGKRWCHGCALWSCPKCRGKIKIFGSRCDHCGWTRKGGEKAR